MEDGAFWQASQTSDTFVIAWQNGQYVVTSVTWGEDSYSITSLSGDSLYANWSYSDGTSGTETLGRVA